MLAQTWGDNVLIAPYPLVTISGRSPNENSRAESFNGDTRPGINFHRTFQEQTMNLHKLFEDFNVKYFGGRLPPYKIVRNAIVGARCERRQRRIIFGHDVSSTDIPAILIHEMTHAATTDRHGRTFNRKLNELKKLGAPTLKSDFVEAQNLEGRKALLNELLEGYWETPNWSAQLRYRAFPIGLVNIRNRLTSQRWAVVLRRAKKKYLALKREERIYKRKELALMNLPDTLTRTEES
jgi:hypothetical protein